MLDDVKVTYGGIPGAYYVSDDAAAPELVELDQCIRCGSLEVMHYTSDKKGDYPQGLGGVWCDRCFVESINEEIERTNDAIEMSLPKCGRCGSNKELVETKDADSVLDGFHCPYCIRFLEHMVAWAEKNFRAADYVSAYRRTKSKFAPGTALIEATRDEVRRALR